MKYEFIFNPQKCWYNKICAKYKTEECTPNCSKYCYLHYLANVSLLTEAQQHPISLFVPPEDKDEIDKLIKIRDSIFDFVHNGKNLLIQSSQTGNGKTTWSQKLLMQYLSKIKYSDNPKALYINVPKFCSMLKNMVAGYTHEDLHFILDNIEKVDLVVWDDLAVTAMTSYDYLNLYVYINQRLDAKKSNIYTSNYVDTMLRQVLGDRLYSRVYNSSQIITFTSGDLRKLNVEV